MRAKKVVAVAAAAFMAASTVGVLAGCRDTAHTINVFLLADADEAKFYNEYFEELEAELKEEGLEYKIDFNYEQEANYYDALNGAINGGETPDIFYVRPNDLLAYKDSVVELQSYADSAVGKEFVNLNDIYDTALNLYRFNPDTGALGNSGDKLYAFPKDLSTQQLGYNRKLVEQYQTQIKAAGLKLPWEMNWETENYSWNDYLKMCKAIADNIDTSTTYAASDVPSVEILAHSFGGELIDLSGGRVNGKVNSLTEGAIKQAIEYQAELVDCGAADFDVATYQNFSAGKICFYGLVGSWQIRQYNNLIKDDNGEPCWEVMPWPTVDGTTDWEGCITSAGYVVSKDCAEMEKGDIAKRIAISFLTPQTQEKLVKDAKISLPLYKNRADDYKNPENDSIYSPKTRGIFLDVISGEHGFFPAKYSTFDKLWLDTLDTALTVMWKKGKGGAKNEFNTTNWAKVQSDMQARYDLSKNS